MRLLNMRRLLKTVRLACSFQYGKTLSEMNFLVGHCLCTVFSDLCTHCVVQLGLLVDIQSFASKVNCVMLLTDDSTLSCSSSVSGNRALDKASAAYNSLLGT